MEFCVPWQSWSANDIHYGLHQVNTRIDNGLFVPIYYANQVVRCQAFHIVSPIIDSLIIESTQNGTFIKIVLPADHDFAKRLVDLDERNLQQATINKHQWWSHKGQMQYQTAVKRVESNKTVEWKIQIPDTGSFSCFDTHRKNWYLSSDTTFQKRKWKFIARTSGLWIDSNSFGMEWKLISAFVI